jgi:hypothetical protein
MDSDPITWFVCRSLGKSVVRALLERGERAEHHDTHFAQDAEDSLWLPDVAGRGWIMLTKDKAIRVRAHERNPFLLAGGRGFFLSGGNLPGDEQSRRFVNALPKMKKIVSSNPAPFLAIVSAKKVELLKPPKRRR